MNENLNPRPDALRHDRTSVEEARAALDRAESTDLDNPSDRRVHALATAAFGALVAAFTGVSQWLDDSTFRGDAPIMLGYVALLLVVAALQSRQSRTWPPGTKRLSMIGVGGSVVVSVAASLLINYLRLDGTVSLGTILALAVATVVPALVAGLLILRGRR